MGDSETERSTFGKWLRQQRRALDLTQQDLADQVGCARITLRRIESDALKPSKELALILLEKVGIPKSEHADWIPFTRGHADLPHKQTNPLPIPLRNNLPAFLTTFIGREKEQADVINLITKYRLVTLTGSGGVGKTRLSIQVAAELLSEYPIGIWLVELAPLTDPALVPQSVCAVLGVKPDGNTSALEALTNYLRSKKILLVMDNCEHLIDACAQLCDALLRSCSELRILASSRESMGIGGEHSYRVPSLSLPNSKNILKIIQESEAVELFVERATAMLPEFELTEFNASFVAQICQRLDGIALAIELAASRVKMFKVEQIAARLDDAFSLLTNGNRTALPRQQTLRALIDWSYNLLSEEEKIFLRKLSVFMGGWTLEAAEAVCETKDALELLTHLVDKSLASVDHEHGDEARYYLLETIRQYSNEKLTDSEQLAHLRDLHFDYFLKTAERIAPVLYTRKMPFWLDYLETEYSNFHLALEGAKEYDSEAGLRLSNALYQFWLRRGVYRKEGIGWFERFLNTIPSKRNKNRAKALLFFSNLLGVTYQSSGSSLKPNIEVSLFLARELGDHNITAEALELYGRIEIDEGSFDAAKASLEQCLSEAYLAENPHLIGRAIYGLGVLAVRKSDFKAAQVLTEKSVGIFRTVGDISMWALGLNLLGLMSNDQGDWKTAQRYYEEALFLAEEARDRSYISAYLSNLGFLILSIGDFDLGRSFLNKGRELVQNTPDDRFLFGILRALGEIARFQDDYDQAIVFYRESLTSAQWDDDKAMSYCLLADAQRLQGNITEAKQYFWTVLQLMKKKSDSDWFYIGTYFFSYIAYYAIDRQMIKQAASILGWNESWNKMNGHIQPPIYRNELDRYLHQAREGLSESEFTAAWTEGQSMRQEQVTALAMEVLQ